MPRRRRRHVRLAVSLLVCTLWLPAAPLPAAGAARTSAELRAELAELSQEESALLETVRATEGEAERLRQAVAELDARIAEVEERLAGATERLAEAQAAALATNERLRRVRGELRQAEGLLREQAVSAYMLGGSRAAHANLLLSVEDAHRLHTARLSVETVLDHQQAIVERVQGLTAEANRLHRTAEEARLAAAVAQEVIATQRSTLVTERDAANGLRAQAQAAIEQHERVLAEVRARQAEHETALAAIRAASSNLAGELGRIQAGQVAVPPQRGRLALPVTAGRLSSGFGMRVHPIFGTERLHAGTDVAAPTGTPIYAAEQGHVVRAGDLGGYGLAVVIEHGDGLATLYAHQSQLLVENGERVQRGQLIGLVGSTGASTGPHLHFEVRVKGVPVDPVHYL